MAGKTIAELKLTEGSLPPRGSDTGCDEDPRGTDWYQMLEDIEELRAKAGWAEDTLSGIAQTIEQTHRVTDGQKRAVRNIEDAISRRRGGSRRYEGWHR